MPDVEIKSVNYVNMTDLLIAADVVLSDVALDDLMDNWSFGDAQYTLVGQQEMLAQIRCQVAELESKPLSEVSSPVDLWRQGNSEALRKDVKSFRSLRNYLKKLPKDTYINLEY